MKVPNREDLWSNYRPSEGDRTARGSRGLMLVGLLKPGLTIPSASTDLDVIARRLETAYPSTNKDITTRVQTFTERYNGNEIRTLFLMMLGAVFFVAVDHLRQRGQHAARSSDRPASRDVDPRRARRARDGRSCGNCWARVSF